MDIYRRRAAMFGAVFVDLSTVQFTPDLLRSVTSQIARKFRVLPVSKSGRRLAVVVSDPSDLNVMDSLHSVLNKELEVSVADESQIDSFIERLYGNDNDFG